MQLLFLVSLKLLSNNIHFTSIIYISSKKQVIILYNEKQFIITNFIYVKETRGSQIPLIETSTKELNFQFISNVFFKYSSPQYDTTFVWQEIRKP